MKLRVTFELPLPAETKPFLAIIAKMFGYSEAAYPDMSMDDFVCQEVCQPQVRALFRTMILNSLSSYLGIAGQDQVAAVAEQFDQTSSVVANVVED